MLLPALYIALVAGEFEELSQAGERVLRIDPDQAEAVEAQVRRFEEKSGRPPGPDDPLFFGHDADEPQPVSLTSLETETVAMLEAAGICPAWIYAVGGHGLSPVA